MSTQQNKVVPRNDATMMAMQACLIMYMHYERPNG